jgi:hypothetical protein
MVLSRSRECFALLSLSLVFVGSSRREIQIRKAKSKHFVAEIAKLQLEPVSDMSVTRSKRERGDCFSFTSL